MKKFFNILIISIFSILCVGSLMPREVVFASEAFGDMKIDEDGNLSGVEKKSTEDGFNTLFEKYRGIIAGVSGIVALSMLLFFIIQAFRMGSSAHNASERQKAIQGLLWLGIATAICGSVSLFTGLFYGMFS